MALAGLLATRAGAETTLVLTNVQMAGMSGFRADWDRPISVAGDGAVKRVDLGTCGNGLVADWSTNRPGAPVFDAVHRSLLVRFPDASGEVAAHSDGRRLVKAELLLDFIDTEYFATGYAEPAGMSFLGGTWTTLPPEWHAVAWVLRRPWAADPQQGPTFNAWLNGAGYWAKYGAQDTTKDRFPRQFGPTEVSWRSAGDYAGPIATYSNLAALALGVHVATNMAPVGAAARMDVTDVLTNSIYGKTLSDRLAVVADQGFLIRKWETYDAKFWQGGYEWATATGPRGIRIAAPRLALTFDTGRGERVKTAPSPDLDALAAKVRGTTTGGQPTAVLPSPESIKMLAARLTLSRPAWMPDWQWERVKELHQLGGGWNFPDTPADYNKWIDGQLAVAPRAWRGFDAPERVEEYFKYLDALPEPVRDHWKLYWSAWLTPDRDFVNGFDFNGRHYGWAQGYIGGRDAQAYYAETHDWRGNFSVYRTYCYAMGTMNFNNWNAIGTLGGGAILESPRLIQDGRHGVEAFSFRLWSWFDGSTQESIDHYYFAESLKAQKCIADWSPTVFEKLMGQSILAKSVEELSSAYHPNLKRFISSSGRTGIGMLLGTQDGLQHILHTLSPTGTITDAATVGPGAPEGAITAPNVEKMPALGHNMLPGIVAAQTVNGPWAPEWVANMVDAKPLPYESVNSYKQWGGFSATPLWKRSFLGRNYGLATLDVSSSETVPVMAQWRRAETPVSSMTELGTLIARAGINRTELLDSTFHDTKQRNPNGIVGAQGHRQFALQYRNKAIILTSPSPQLKFDGSRPIPEQVTSLQTTLGLFNFEATPSWELYVDGQRVTQFPCKAKLSQRLAIKDGVSYVGLIPLPATDLGRTEEIVIADDGRMTDMQNGGKAREALRINLYNMLREAPLDKATADWGKIDRAFNGFVIELGDQAEYGDFAAFQKHLAAATLEAVWDEGQAQLNVVYKSGDDVMECGFNPAYDGGPTIKAFPYRRVNGRWPYNAPGVERDTTLTQQSTTGRIEKNGAVLVTEPGRMAYVQTEPKSGTYAAFNAFPDPTTLAFTVPGGITVRGDGRLGMTRVVVRPKENRLWIDYAVQSGQSATNMAAALLVLGCDAGPSVDLNGKPITGKLQQRTVDGQSAYVVPLGAP